MPKKASKITLGTLPNPNQVMKAPRIPKYPKLEAKAQILHTALTARQTIQN